MTSIPQLPVGRKTAPGTQSPPPTSPRPDAVSGTTIGVNAAALASALRTRVRGEVRFDDGDRALYSTDASNYRQLPVGVILPRDADDIVETVAVCREFGAPIVSRGLMSATKSPWKSCRIRFRCSRGCCRTHLQTCNGLSLIRLPERSVWRRRQVRRRFR